MNDAPNFLVEWPSRWDEFLTAIGPAMGKSPKRLAGEAQVGLFPWWGILLSWAFELLLLVAVIVVPAKLASMQPYEPPPKPKYDIIYYSSNELPRTEDVGGAEAGRSGRSGGREAHHPTQTIRVARGSTLRETVADAPKLDLPKSNSAVANLLALKALPGPAPAEGMRSSLRAPALTQTAVAPAPQVPDQLRAAPQTECRRGSAQRGGAAARGLHTSSARIECGASGSAAGFGSGANDQSESAGWPCRRRAWWHRRPPWLDEVARPWDRASGRANCRTRSFRLPVQVGDASAQRATSAAWAALRLCLPPSNWAQVQRNVHVAGGMGTGTAVVPPPPSVSGGGSLTGQGRGNRGARIGRTAGRRRGHSAAQQQWRRQRLGRGGFQPARIEGWPARQRRKRRPGHVSLRRRQARPGRIGRRRGHRPRRWTGQRILRPRIRRGQGRHRPRIRSHGARRNFALSRRPAAPARAPVALPPCPESR